MELEYIAVQYRIRNFTIMKIGLCTSKIILERICVEYL